MTESFQGLINFRDVGESIKRSTGVNYLRSGCLFRSARLDNASRTDIDILVDHYKIRSVIDLRTDTERLHRKATPTFPDSLRGLIIDFNGRAYTRALMQHLTYWQSTQLLLYYALGYRKQAISILSEHVLSKRGLIGLANDSIDHCTTEVKAVFDVLVETERLPLLIHCTQGKDRTGLVVLLILMLLDTPPDVIQDDYCKSQAELAPEREERLTEIQSIGLPASFADCADGWAQEVISYIRQKYGGIAAYLTHCGVHEGQQQQVILLLRSDSVSTT